MWISYVLKYDDFPLISWIQNCFETYSSGQKIWEETAISTIKMLVLKYNLAFLYISFKPVL